MTEAGILNVIRSKAYPLRVRYSLTPYGRTLVPVFGSSLFVGQRTFETRSLYLIHAGKLFTLAAANEMLSLLAMFAGKSDKSASQ